MKMRSEIVLRTDDVMVVEDTRGDGEKKVNIWIGDVEYGCKDAEEAIARYNHVLLAMNILPLGVNERFCFEDQMSGMASR
jgi:hypothetical protein